jgi:hypothetical protein
MAVRTDFTVDWSASPRIITIADPSASVSIQDLHDTLRSIEDEPANMAYDHLINSAGKESLGAGVLVGITAELQNAKLAFEARGGPSFVQCTIIGGNLVAVDGNGDAIEPIETTAYTQVVLTNSTSASLIAEWTAVDIARVRAMAAGRMQITGDQLILRDTDNSIVATFNLFDSLGDPTEVNVFDRQPT